MIKIPRLFGQGSFWIVQPTSRRINCQQNSPSPEACLRMSPGSPCPDGCWLVHYRNRPLNLRSLYWCLENITNLQSHIFAFSDIPVSNLVHVKLTKFNVLLAAIWGQYGDNIVKSWKKHMEGPTEKKKQWESILQLGNLINTCRSIMTSQFYFFQLSSKGTSTNSNYAKNKGQFSQQNRDVCDILLWSVT